MEKLFEVNLNENQISQNFKANTPNAFTIKVEFFRVEYTKEISGLSGIRTGDCAAEMTCARILNLCKELSRTIGLCKEMKAVSAQVVSCCVYENLPPTKNYAAHTWQNSILA